MQTVSAQLQQLGFANNPIPQLATDELQNNENELLTIMHLPNAQFKNFKTITKQLEDFIRKKLKC